jgi:hypothetical protein
MGTMKSFIIEMYCRLSVPMWAGLFLYLGWKVLISFGHILGLDTADLDKQQDAGVAIFAYIFLFTLLIIGAFAGCLLCCISLSKIFRLPENDFRRILLSMLKINRKERLLQRYYFWCFKMAYGNEI